MRWPTLRRNEHHRRTDAIGLTPAPVATLKVLGVVEEATN